MQYILTQEEYDNLAPKWKVECYEKQIDILNKKVLELSGCRCIYDNKFGYCDFCPLSSFGTNTCNKVKQYSK